MIVSSPSIFQVVLAYDFLAMELHSFQAFLCVQRFPSTGTCNINRFRSTKWTEAKETDGAHKFCTSLQRF
jgi:hypothetical protein